MKKVYFVILVLIFLIRQNVFAQIYLGVSGMRINSIDNTANFDAGTGCGLSFLNKCDSLINKRSTFPVLVQFGGNCFYSSLGQRTFYDVPLLAPQVGGAKVKLFNSLL